MNKTGVIAKLSEKTGLAAHICEKIAAAFEEEAEEALIARFKGGRSSHEDMIKGISEKSGVAAADCERVMAAFDETLDGALSDKLRFLK